MTLSNAVKDLKAEIGNTRRTRTECKYATLGESRIFVIPCRATFFEVPEPAELLIEAVSGPSPRMVDFSHGATFIEVPEPAEQLIVAVSGPSPRMVDFRLELFFSRSRSRPCS